MHQLHRITLPRHRRFERVALALTCDGNPAAAQHTRTKQRHMARIERNRRHKA